MISISITLWLHNSKSLKYIVLAGQRVGRKQWKTKTICNVLIWFRHESAVKWAVMKSIKRDAIHKYYGAYTPWKINLHSHYKNILLFFYYQKNTCSPKRNKLFVWKSNSFLRTVCSALKWYIVHVKYIYTTLYITIHKINLKICNTNTWIHKYTK